MRRILLLSFFIFSLFLGFPFAAHGVTQDEALERAKEIFPQALAGKESELEIQLFEDEYGKSQWGLYWTDPAGDSYFDILISAGDGSLTYCDIQTKEDALKVPEKILTREEAERIAYQFATGRHPGKMASVVPYKDYLTPDFKLDRGYSFAWQQVIGVVPVEDNYIVVNVEAVSGTVTGFECHWQEASPTAPGTIMSLEEFSSQAMDRLGAFPYYIALPSTEGGFEAKLTYSVDSATHYFDAGTGAPLDDNGSEISWEEARLFSNLVIQDKPGQETALSGFGRGITSAQGEKIAAGFFEKIGLKGIMNEAGISRDNRPGYWEELWNYTLSLSTENDADISYIIMSVKAANGRIARYYREYYDEYYGDPESTPGTEISYDQALQTARSFLSNAGIQETGNYILMPQMAIHYDDARNVYRFWWCRTINGIPSDDYLGVEVSRRHGQVVYFYEASSPVSSFASMEGILSASQAAELFKEIQPFQLTYVRYGEDTTAQPKLVYGIDIKKNSIEAHSGTVFAPEASLWSFILESYDEKLQDHWGQAPLNLLSETGRLPFPGLFDPNGTVKRRDGLRIMELVTAKVHPEQKDTSPFSDVPETDRDILPVIHAAKNDILESGGALRPNDPLTREDLAVWIINAIGYKEVAESPVSMEVQSKDASKISKGKRNYVALARAFKLLTDDRGGNFRPQDPVNWGQLAAAITRAFPKLEINTKILD